MFSGARSNPLECERVAVVEAVGLSGIPVISGASKDGGGARLRRFAGMNAWVPIANQVDRWLTMNAPEMRDRRRPAFVVAGKPGTEKGADIKPR